MADDFDEYSDDLPSIFSAKFQGFGSFSGFSGNDLLLSTYQYIINLESRENVANYTWNIKVIKYYNGEEDNFWILWFFLCI